MFGLLAGVYSALGFDELGDEVFRDLVIARDVEPTSLLDVGRVLAEMGRQSAIYPTLMRVLRRATPTGTESPPSEKTVYSSNRTV